MKALVTTCRDPFRPANHRSVDFVRRRRSLRNLAPRGSAPVVCQVNGQWLPRRAWSRRVQDGDTVLFVVLPQGGGNGGSNPLRIILTVVVMIVAWYAAPALMGYGAGSAGYAAAAAAGSTLSVSMAAAAINIVGSALVSAILPASTASKAAQATALAAASPTYSIGAQGNTARIGSPIPVIYGRHMVYPDFAAMPYVEYAGNEQYLYQLFCIGQGEYEIEDIRVDDTKISSFSEITYEVVAPGGRVTLFPTAVATSEEVSGQEALTATTLGPFVAHDAGTLANFLAIDVVMSRGLYHANDSGGLDTMTCNWHVEAQLIDDVGTAIGSWFTLGTESVSKATTTPLRYSYKYPVAEGRYQVRLTRTDAKNTGTAYGHELDWAGLRAYLPGTQSYGDVTVVAMRLRATNNLSTQASRKINMIVTRKLPTWNPSLGWSAPVATRSIAWAIADIARAAYGGQLPDSRINLQGLYDLDVALAARGDTFNAVYDSQSSVMEALTQAARAGRAVPFQQGGVLHVVRDAPATIPVALFSQRNIVRNSLKIDYLMPSDDTADDVIVTYFDEQTWSDRTVRCVLPGSVSEKPAQIKLFGVTIRQQAWNEGMFTAACNRYRRRIPTFSTEMEGFIPTIADLIAVSHAMPKWGQSGDIVAWNEATKEATVSEPLDWSATGAHVICLRRRNGSPAGPIACTAGADAYHVTLTDWDAETDPTPDTGGDRERTHYAFGPANEQYIRCRMVTMRPKSAETVEIISVIESDYVHVADTGVAPGVTAWQLPSKFTSPVVSGLTAASMPDAVERMVISWQPAAGADHYIIEQGNGDGSWTRIGEVSACSFSATALYGAATIIRVAAVGMTRGPWVSVAYGKLADYMWMGDSQPTWSGDTNKMWRY